LKYTFAFLIAALLTAEERGLLGSETFGVHPLYAPPKMVANLTIDILQTAGPSRDVVLVGAGQNDLEKDLARPLPRKAAPSHPTPNPNAACFIAPIITPSPNAASPRYC
jgi:Zn-dependent M28 family amino/carboxypeptidase